MDHTTMSTLARAFLEAWNTQEVDRVLDCYTEDLLYSDPNTRGPVVGRSAMERYLAKLFASWTMTWALREAHLLDGGQGCALLWHGTFRRAEGGPTQQADGMDLVLLRDDRIQRNDVVFDRSRLGGALGSESLKQLLLRGWMTHDAMWFKSALDELGIDAANRLNRAAIRAMAPIEVRRTLRALGMEQVSTYAALERFMAGAMGLLAGDYMRFEWRWEPPDRLWAQVQECFAHRGITRLGAIDHYQCGIFDRIYGWLDALGISYQVTPAVEHCTMHHQGSCVRELRFTFER